MLKIFAKLIVLPVMVILIALSFTVSILSKIHYLAAVLVNAIFIMCAVIALSLRYGSWCFTCHSSYDLRCVYFS